MISNTIYTKPTQSTFMDYPQQLKNNNNNIYKSKHHYSSSHNNQYKIKQQQQQHVTDPFAGMKEYVDYQQKIEQLKAIMIPTTKSSSSLTSTTKKYTSSSSSIHKQSYDSIDCNSSITSMDTSNSSHSDHTLNECLTPRSLSPTSDHHHHHDYYHTSEHPSSTSQQQQQQLFKRNDISDDEKIRFIHFIQRRSGWSRTFVNKSFLEQDHSLWSTNQYQYQYQYQQQQQQPTTTTTTTSYYRLF
ncbi:unnamed protein product [Cunninghamella echinulata]